MKTKKINTKKQEGTLVRDINQFTDETTKSFYQYLLKLISAKPQPTKQFTYSVTSLINTVSREKYSNLNGVKPLIEALTQTKNTKGDLVHPSYLIQVSYNILVKNQGCCTQV